MRPPRFRPNKLACFGEDRTTSSYLDCCGLENGETGTLRGTSFSDIQNGVRIELAQRHIKTGKTLAETSQLLGFRGLPAFSRWFRSQLGKSASEWRKAES
jgi:hypothetical protein